MLRTFLKLLIISDLLYPAIGVFKYALTAVQLLPVCSDRRLAHSILPLSQKQLEHKHSLHKVFHLHKVFPTCHRNILNTRHYLFSRFCLLTRTFQSHSFFFFCISKLKLIAITLPVWCLHTCMSAAFLHL